MELALVDVVTSHKVLNINKLVTSTLCHRLEPPAGLLQKGSQSCWGSCVAGEPWATVNWCGGCFIKNLKVRALVSLSFI